ncbi:RloB family protein [Subsaximicrobium wynnwilliamsii]|uniref:RloB family protein n=1 Tax=Subsaximicrobium wynnwilliamsii TaxID=291179 RepID=UPI001673D174|nr:RloB family protein [Subsaximicrobium wynnwilliamsii]
MTIKFSRRGLILCEGETEENYFTGLVTQEKYRRKFSSIDVQIVKPKDHSPLGLVNEAKLKIKEAKREKNPYDFIWVIFDRDGHAKIPEAFETARTSTPEIKIVYTKPCFEFYVLLHFEKTTKPFTKCDDVISYINKKYQVDYKKASNLFDLLLTQKETGLSNGDWVVNQFEDEIASGKKIYELSAFSNVHVLVEYLYSLL